MLSDSESNFEYSNNLLSLRLPGPITPFGEDSTTENNNTISEIKKLAEEMKKNVNRTTNFASVLYFIENNCDKILYSQLLLKLKKDYNLNKNLFLNSNSKKPFTSEASFLRSVNYSLKKNKSFNIEIIKNDKYIIFNPSYALNYLKKMYQKYTNDDDITSISSQESPHKISYQSIKKEQSKKFLGNKTIRKNSRKNLILNQVSIDSYDSINSEIEEKSASTYKFLRENLKGKAENNMNNIIINNSNKIYNKRKKIKDKDNNINVINNIKNIFSKEFSFPNVDNVANTNCENDFSNISNSINKSMKMFSSIKKKIDNVNGMINNREIKKKELDEDKSKIVKIKEELNIMYQIFEIKYDIVKNIKKEKDQVEKNKASILLYKELIDSKIKNLKKCLSDVQKLDKEIIYNNKDIPKEMKNIKIVENGTYFYGKNDIKKDYNNLCKKIKDDKMKECESSGFSNKNNYRIVDEIIEKFSKLEMKINDELKF